MEQKHQTNSVIPGEYRISQTPNAVINKWITIGVLAIAWLSLIISLLR